MSKLHMIRLENGDALVLQANNEREAQVRAGLTLDPAEMATHAGVEDVAEFHLYMKDLGVGPQISQIRELRNFRCHVHIEDNAICQFSMENSECLGEIFADYPEIQKALAQILDFDSAQRNCQSLTQAILEDAVMKERTRLLVSPQ